MSKWVQFCGEAECHQRPAPGLQKRSQGDALCCMALQPPAVLSFPRACLCAEVTDRSSIYQLQELKLQQEDVQFHREQCTCLLFTLGVKEGKGSH